MVDLRGLHDLRGAFERGELNVDKFIEVRESKECADFRRWLHDLDDASDEEIHDQTAALRVRMGNAVQSRTGRAIRLAVATGTGFIPLVGPLAGLAMSGIDSFVVDEVLPESGPVVFLDRLYPSLFDK